VPESDFRVKSYDHFNFSRASVVNFERLSILYVWIGPPCDKLRPFEFLKSFRCPISSFSIYYAPESDFHVTSYDHFNFSRASVVQFRSSRYIMRLNKTSVLQVMAIWISRELPLFNSELLDILSAGIGVPCAKLWQFEYLESFRCSIRESLYSICRNRSSVWKVMTIWISRELSLFNFERLGILCAWIGQPCDKLWPFEFLESFCCSISSFLIYYAP